MNDAENATVNDARTTKVQVRSLHTTVSIPANAEASLICTSWIAPANIAKDIYGYRDKKVGGVWGRRILLHYGCVALWLCCTRPDPSFPRERANKRTCSSTVNAVLHNRVCVDYYVHPAAIYLDLSGAVDRGDENNHL